MFLVSCSGGSSQTPALSGSADSLGKTLDRQGILRSFVPNKSGGFMDPLGARTQLLYTSSGGTASVVDVLTMNGRQVGQITNGLVFPWGLFVDAKGSLWVANFSNVLVYSRGALSPSKTLADPVGYPVDVTVCPDGTAYVADYSDNSDGHASIQVYAPGGSTPTGKLDYAKDFENAFLTCDAAGNVFVALFTGQYLGEGLVVEFPLGKQKGAKDLGIVLQDPGGIKPDNAGNLLITDVALHTITEYTEKGSPTGKSIATGTATEGIAVTRKGTIVLGATDTTQDGPVDISWSWPGGKQLRVYTCCSRIGPPLQYNYDVALYPGQKGI
jgi:hypothetical protein